jgi:hypothetical protein
MFSNQWHGAISGLLSSIFDCSTLLQCELTFLLLCTPKKIGLLPIFVNAQNCKRTKLPELSYIKQPMVIFQVVPAFTLPSKTLFIYYSHPLLFSIFSLHSHYYKMIASILFKFSIVFTLIAFVCANAESELEQPTKLLGGIVSVDLRVKHSSLTYW